MNKCHVIIPRAQSKWEVLVFQDGSDELSDFLDAMEIDNRPYYIADQVAECLGPTK